MSLKRMAMKMALAFAAAKGVEAFRNRGGMQGVKSMLAGAGGGRAGGAGGGGLSSLLGGLTGGTGGAGGTGMGGAGLGGLLGGLAAMAGGSAALGQPQAAQSRMIDDGPDDEETAHAMVRAIGQAVRADGQIDAEERAVLQDILGEADTEEDRAALDFALSEPVDPEALARDVPHGSEGQVYAAALTAIDPDHPAERDYLGRFAKALRLRDAELRQLHEAAGKAM
ncbi:DUF533 domain-containing protein [uncultured Jannaschia sp.]|uniref:DUF533 domain-containing protein n=1 Tax=uncultured Jannaschia sp. TaxID=293347 RepID=UPI0026185B96|nr:DUF533 domain-containing protein [uncultured Jannaschia sp.]